MIRGNRRRARNRPTRAWRCRATLLHSPVAGVVISKHEIMLYPQALELVDTGAAAVAGQHHKIVSAFSFTRPPPTHPHIVVDQAGNRVKYRRRVPESLARGAALDAGTGLRGTRGSQNREHDEPASTNRRAAWSALPYGGRRS